MFQSGNIFLVVIAICVASDVCEGFPSIERPPPDETSGALRSAGPRSQFSVPEGLEFLLGDGKRRLEAATVDEVKDWMSDTVADNDSTSQSFILSYAGRVSRYNDTITLTAPNEQEYTLDLTKYPAIEKVTILKAAKTIIVDIHRIGKKQKALLRKFIDDLESVPAIYVVEADSEAVPRSVPNDPLFSYLWHFRNSNNPAVHANVEASWARLSKRRERPIKPVYLAIIDSPVDVTHPELSNRLFTNNYEKVDGTDTDNNGCVDDVHNCNFSFESAKGAGSTLTASSHGTHVAGIAGAQGNNNNGIVGVGMEGVVQLMPVGVALTETKAAVSSVLRAIDYCLMMGVRVSNNSYGFSEPIPSLKAALLVAFREYNFLFVGAISNSYQQDASDVTNRFYHDYPARYQLPNTMMVASVGDGGNLSSFSGYGLDVVQIAAPGESIISTANDNTYSVMQGTSMATPMVAAAAAQLIAAYPSLVAQQVRRILVQSVRKFPMLKRFVESSGVVDADRALLFAQCEVAFSEARRICNAEASQEHISIYVAANTKRYAESLAVHCEGTAAVIECMYKELEKTKEQACYRRTCDILEGQCDDLRVESSGTPPKMRLGDECKYGRLFDSTVISIHADGVKGGSAGSAMKAVQQELIENVLQSNEELVMDAAVASDGGHLVSGVINIYA
eukprot:Lankesteria_metandrocarpae@DN1251_c0_g1_i1.p1